MARRVEKKWHARSGLMFLDSGAHSLYNEHVFKTGKYRSNLKKEKYAWYETQEFWDYVDRYAAFVKERLVGIDYYANVDVIHNPEKSWEVLQYLEKTHGLNPVPVIHHGASLKWVRRHLKAGYELIGLGGAALGMTKNDYIKWADHIFDYLCPYPSRLPIVRVHGFAQTAWKTLVRYPWWSVDSASWTKAGSFGRIFIPKKVNGEYSFAVAPYGIRVSNDSPKGKDLHVVHLDSGSLSLAVVQEWLDSIGVPLGKVDAEGNEVERGVVTQQTARKIANIRFFEAMVKSLPEYPWAFRVPVARGFFEL